MISLRGCYCTVFVVFEDLSLGFKATQRTSTHFLRVEVIKPKQIVQNEQNPTLINILNENAIFIAFYDNRSQDHFKIKKKKKLIPWIHRKQNVLTVISKHSCTKLPFTWSGSLNDSIQNQWQREIKIEHNLWNRRLYCSFNDYLSGYCSVDGNLTFTSKLSFQ